MASGNNMQNRGGKKKGGGGAFLIFLLVVLMPRLIELMQDADLERTFHRMRIWALRNGIDPDMLPALVVGAVVLLIVLISVASVSKKRGRAPVRRESPARERVRTSGGRTSAATQRPDPRKKTFTQPDPYCVVCDHTGEDHFQRDKAQRIRQLDDWLQIGLIDREEYRVLKDRFQRDL